MAVTVRIEPIRKDIEVLVRDLSDDAAAQFASFASDQIEDAKEINRSVLGRVPPFKIAVDGSQVTSLNSVKADSVVVVEFELISEVLIFIAEQLQMHSPVKGGTYRRSHVLLADGHEVEPRGQIELAEEYVFVNTTPYARKIERGSSSQAPDGVYQAVASLARGRFRTVGRISYGFRTVVSGRIATGRKGNRASNRNPAIIVRLNA